MNTKKIKILATLAILAVMCFSYTSCTNTANKKQSLTDDEIVSIATEAYIYGYPMVLMELTKKVLTNFEEPNNFGNAPINQIGHFRQFPDDKFTAVVKPNVDTYYSMAWMNLKEEPLVLSVPATDRYYLLPMLDAYSNVFAVPGTRTTGTGANNFLVAGPFWEGNVPDGMTLIKSPTSLVWLVGRTQVNSPEDGATVVKTIQDDLTLVPLKNFGKEYTAPKGTIVEDYKKIVPVKTIEAMPFAEYMTLMAQLMADNPPAAMDSALVGKMASIGIIPGQAFKTDDFSDVLLEKLNGIPQMVDQAFKKEVTSTKPEMLINGWNILYRSEAMGNYGTDYNFRGLIAYVGLGANLTKDAAYPNTTFDSEGNLLNAANKYVIHFGKDEIPPVNAFWSLTLYDNRNFLAANPINRFALGDRDNLKYNVDGSLDIYIQTENPGKDKESNWLPAPKEGNFELTLRLYWPKEEVLDGTWVPVAVEKIKD